MDPLTLPLTPPATLGWRSSMQWAGLAMLAAMMLSGCSAPATFIDNADQHRCYLDGVLETRSRVPFRYYGTSRVDVVPANVNGTPDWDHQPMTLPLPLEPPASPWLFPLDFVLEAAYWAFADRTAIVATIAPPPTPPEWLVERDVRPTGLDQVRARAHAARIIR